MCKGFKLYIYSSLSSYIESSLTSWELGLDRPKSHRAHHLFNSFFYEQPPTYALDDLQNLLHTQPPILTPIRSIVTQQEIDFNFINKNEKMNFKNKLI